MLITKSQEAKKRLKEQAATSDMTTKRMIAGAMSGLDFGWRAKLLARISCELPWEDGQIR